MSALAEPIGQNKVRQGLHVEWADDLLHRSRTGRDEDPEWLRQIHEAGAERFHAIGFPGPKDEEWRSTNAMLFLRDARALAGEAAVGPEALQPYGLADAWRLVFVNGRLCPSLCSLDGLPEGVLAGSLREAPVGAALGNHFGRVAQQEPHGFAALNSACFLDAAGIVIPKGIAMERPIQVVHLAVGGQDPSVVFPRTFLLAGELSKVTFVEVFASLGNGVLADAVTEITVGEGAILDHYQWQAHQADASHVDLLAAQAGRTSVLRTTNLTTGAALARSDVHVSLTGEGAEATLNGLYVVRGRQHTDHHTRIDHLAPHCQSHELYKGILDEHGRAVFTGRIFVQKDAQKTDAKQTNQNLLLSRDAWVDTKPQLEIFADDVRCTHGATVGRLSEDALFYCRSRGIPQEMAEKLLIYAFAAEILERVRVPNLRDRVEAAILGPGVQIPR